jgi:TPR repeat protein
MYAKKMKRASITTALGLLLALPAHAEYAGESANFEPQTTVADALTGWVTPDHRAIVLSMLDSAGAETVDGGAATDEFKFPVEQDESEALYNLARMYELGSGVPRDDRMAAKWYRLAADKGHAEAQYRLAVLHHVGRGVPQDLEKAADWYRRAALQNVPAAQYNLGVLYASGYGPGKSNSGEAVTWYRLAALQGYADAQFDLGVMHANGQGVPKDLVAAHMWLELAAEQGIERARIIRDAIGTLMTATELEEAERRAKEMADKAQ